MRILLFAGKGGVGKTTTAAATAAIAARAGARTVICSTDPAHSLGDVFDVELGDDVRQIAAFPETGGSLAGQQLDSRVRLEQTWGEIREYLVALLDWAGAEVLEAQELAVIPGLDEVFALADLKAYAESGLYDLVVVDCAPTAETLRLLSLPDVLGWYMDRLFPAQRSITRAVRPVLRRMMNMPIASDDVFDAVRRFYDRLDGVRELLMDSSRCTARLVVNAQRMVVAESRRTFSYLSLFGYHVDAVIANRLLPDAVTDPWFSQAKQDQGEQIRVIEGAFAPVPILVSELTADEPIGLRRLLTFGETLYGARNPMDCMATAEPLRICARDQSVVLSVWLPFVDKREVELVRSHDEVLLALGSYRRAVALPDSLARRLISGAHMTGDRLEIEFVEP